MSDEYGRSITPEYGKLPEEPEAPHKFYEKGLEALSNLSNFREHFTGRNEKTIDAMIIALNFMLADDRNELIPEGADQLGEDEDAYQAYQQALATIEQYIKENKSIH